MTDPRQSLPDTILTTPDGQRILVRCPQLIVSAPRGGPVSITLDIEIFPVRQEVDGVATKLGFSICRKGIQINLEDTPPELAMMLATWMANQAEPLAPEVLPELKKVTVENV